MSDDELRRRLRDVPGPRAGLDVQAVLAGARRTRRPKVAAMTAATTGAAVLIVAPFVVPALSPIAPTGGAAVSDQGAEHAGAPAQESGEDAAGVSEPDSPALACGYPAIVDETGIRASFLDDPADGVADLELSGVGAGTALQILGVAVAQVAADRDVLAIVAAPDPAALEGAPPVGRSDEDAVVGTRVLRDGAVLDAPAIDCGIDAPSAPAPLLLVELEGRRIAVVGDPWAVR